MHESSVPCSQVLHEGSGQGEPFSKPSCRAGRAWLGVTHTPPGTSLGTHQHVFCHINQLSSYWCVCKTRGAERSLPLPPKGCANLPAGLKNNLCCTECKGCLGTGAFLCSAKSSLGPLVQKFIYPKCQQIPEQCPKATCLFYQSPWVSQMSPDISRMLLVLS